jgi:hypothetical protein
VTLISLAFGCRCDSVVEMEVAPELVEMATAEEVVPVPFEIFRAAPLNLAMYRFAVMDQWTRRSNWHLIPSKC